MLDALPDLEVVGEAADGREAVELCRRLRPDLVLMDMSMPTMDGLEATLAIKGAFPKTIVLVLTASGDPNNLSQALIPEIRAQLILNSSPCVHRVPWLLEAKVEEL
jgi:DNA-binding NarL/FixJ family response regulator